MSATSHRRISVGRASGEATESINETFSPSKTFYMEADSADNLEDDNDGISDWDDIYLTQSQ